MLPMNALWFDLGNISLRQLPRPQPAAGEVLLRTRLAGICGTDLALLQGYSQFQGVPGHEFVADVVEGPHHWLGQRVVAGINLGCGDCDFCIQDRAEHCRARQVVGIRQAQGAFAEYLCVPASNLLAVPTQLSDELAAMAEPVAAALQILEQVKVPKTASVLIIGAGRMAQLIARVLLAETSNIDVLARTDKRWRYFTDLPVSLLTGELKTRQHYDIVVECSGNPSGLTTAMAAVKPLGTIVLKSTYGAETKIDASSLVVNEITLLGSRCGPMKRALDWLVSNPLPVEILASQTFALEDGAQALDRAKGAEAGKCFLSSKKWGQSKMALT
ncbi:MAG: threonine dehydrogenase-like Zn-dependent dehydrogenase [Crocinitomicaceae bacterium]